MDARPALARRLGLPLVVVALLVTGCSSGKKDTGQSSSSTARPTLSAPSTATPSSGSSSSASTSSAPAVPKVLGGGCDTVLPLSAVESALNARVVGKTMFIVNLPDAKIGMTERINCRYGGAAKGPKTKQLSYKVEASVSAYQTPAQAKSRVQATIAYWRDQGATQSAVPLSGDAAYLLKGYGTPLLVVSHDRVTVAVNGGAALLAGRNAAAVLAQIAAQAISRVHV